MSSIMRWRKGLIVFVVMAKFLPELRSMNLNDQEAEPTMLAMESWLSARLAMAQHQPNIALEHFKIALNRMC